jgi:hypothetical protein
MMSRKILLWFLLLVSATLANPVFGQSFGSVQKFPVGPIPTKVVAADFNNDTIPDLATLDTSGNSISILIGKGDGSFAPVQHFDIAAAGNFAAGTDLAVANITHVGNIDLLVYHSGFPDGATVANEDVSYVFEGRGDGTFKLPPKTCSCMATTAKPGPMVLGDLSGDGNVAFVQAMYTPGPNNAITSGIRTAFGNELGNFGVSGVVDTGAASQNGTGSMITDPVLGDFNDDGHTDAAYVAMDLNHDDAQVSFLINQANAINFPNFKVQPFDTVQLPLTRITAGDMNGDGRVDMLLTYSGCAGTCQGFFIYTNQGGGKFQRGPNFSLDPSVYASPIATLIADFNEDKRSDVAFLTRKNAENSAQSTDVVVIFAQAADGSFAPDAEVALDLPGENIAPTNLVIADFNRDGLPDIAVSSSIESNVAVVLNVPPPPPAPDFALALSSPTVTVNSGGSANLNINITALNGFNAAVSLSCSGLPSHATCTFVPAQVTPASTPAASVLTISTNAVTTASVRHPSPRFLFATSFPVLGLVFLYAPVIRRRRRLLGLSLLFLPVLLAIAMAGCGGSGTTATSQPQSAPPASSPAPIGTPAGAYIIRVVASSTSTVHSATVTLNVQ